MKNSCVDCGESDVVVLQFDHVRGEKFAHVSAMSTHSIKKIKEEIAKCEVVCANCHFRREAKRGNWYNNYKTSYVPYPFEITT